LVGGDASTGGGVLENESGTDAPPGAAVDLSQSSSSLSQSIPSNGSPLFFFSLTGSPIQTMAR